MLSLSKYVVSLNGETVAAFRVEGLPHGVEANIVRAPHGWQLNRHEKGERVEPTRDYVTAEEALAALQREFANPA